MFFSDPDNLPFSGLDHAVPNGRKPTRDARLSEFDDVTLVDELRARADIAFIVLAREADTDGMYALAVAVASENPIALRSAVMQAIASTL